MTATRLPFNNFDGIIAEDKVEFSVKWHGDGHISEEFFYTWHIIHLNIKPECLAITVIYL
jgi:hypothetical protein